MRRIGWGIPTVRSAGGEEVVLDAEVHPTPPGLLRTWEHHFADSGPESTKPVPMPSGGLLVQDEAALACGCELAEEWTKHVKSRAEHEPDPALRALYETEYDSAKKLCLLRGGAPFWFIPDEPQITEAPPIKNKRAYEASWYLQDKLGATAEAARAQITSFSYPRGTSHGEPDYASSDESLLFHTAAGLLARARGSAEVWEWLRSLNGPLALPRPHDVELARQMPLGKEIPEKGGVPLSFIAMLLHCYCRKRGVKGKSSWQNVAILEDVQRIRGALRRMHMVHFDDMLAVLHSLNCVHAKGAAYWGEEMEECEDDISGFDDSVSRWHQETQAERYLALTGNPRFVANWLWSQDITLATPGLNPSETMLHRVRGRTRSGIYSTWEDGVNHNMPGALTGLTAGLSLKDEFEAADLVAKGVLGLWLYGDDTGLVVPKRRFDEKKYVEANGGFGFTRKLHRGHFVMLAKKYDRKRGVAYGIMSRLLQNTVFPDGGHVNPAHFLLALWARTWLAPWSPVYPEFLKLLQRFMDRDVSRAALREALKSSESQRELLTLKRTKKSWASAMMAAADRGQLPLWAASIEPLPLSSTGLGNAELEEIVRTYMRSEVNPRNQL